MSDDLFRRLASRITNMLARGKVSSVKATTKMQTLQVELLAGEAKDRLEHFEPAGFTSCPKPGAEAVAGFFDGDRSHGVVLIVADRRYRLTTLVPGEVAIFDDQGQKVHITRAGIVVDGGGKPIIMRNAPTITLDAPDVYVTGNLHVAENIIGAKDVFDHMVKSMAAMRNVYGGHDHDDPHGGKTAGPNQAM